jgi:hypothetical protein
MRRHILFATLSTLKNRVQHYKALAKAIFVHLKAAAGYEWNPKMMIKSHTTLLRPTSAVLKAEEDYGLSKVGISLMLYTLTLNCQFLFSSYVISLTHCFIPRAGMSQSVNFWLLTMQPRFNS